MTSCLNFLKNYDKFERPIEITLHGESSQSTSIGGFASIILNLILLAYTFLKGSTVLFRRDNELSQASFVTDFDELGKIQIDGKEIMFQIANPEFDNFDNEYFQFTFKMLKYDNSVYSEIEVRIEPCESDLLPPW